MFDIKRYNPSVFVVPPLEVKLVAPGQWVSAGQQSVFKCKVVGSSPEPIVQWWLGGRQLIPSTAPVSTPPLYLYLLRALQSVSVNLATDHFSPLHPLTERIH